MGKVLVLGCQLALYRQARLSLCQAWGHAEWGLLSPSPLVLRMPLCGQALDLLCPLSGEKGSLLLARQRLPLCWLSVPSLPFPPEPTSIHWILTHISSHFLLSSFPSAYKQDLVSIKQTNKHSLWMILRLSPFIPHSVKEYSTFTPLRVVTP